MDCREQLSFGIQKVHCRARTTILLLLIGSSALAGNLPDFLDIAGTSSELRATIERYQTDRQLLGRSYPVWMSSTWRERTKSFTEEWVRQLEEIDFMTLSREGKVDYLLFKNHLAYELRELEREAKTLSEAEPLIPFAGPIIRLEEERRSMKFADGEQSAKTLWRIRSQIDSTRKAIDAELASSDKRASGFNKSVASRAVRFLDELRDILKHWFEFYNGYDPVLSWWTSQPYKEVDSVLVSYTSFVRGKIVGVKSDDETTIIGDPIGKAALAVELAHEMIPYTPEELITIANREFAWCEAEMNKASHELGFGDDWHAALEYVKMQHVDPGKQPELIRDLALEAIQFLKDHDLVTIPPLAEETWRMEMLSPKQQLVSPFFLGGEVIQVSYPTNTMTHEQKMMSMRWNNIHFARATVFHELIPGHHMQGFMTERYRPYRGLFSTPFWVEGGALYWEMMFWDLNFPKSPENKIGMLFWRMHRCARVIFSLNFHLGKMTPQECIDFLVDRVGHERENATAEVRRSFGGDYSPLYQCAYLLGALQFRALHKELVDGGKMTNREFHDAVFRENSIPVEMLRAYLTGQEFDKDYQSSWRFYDELTDGRK